MDVSTARAGVTTVWNDRYAGSAIKLVLTTVSVLVVALVGFDVSMGVVVNGLATGTLYGILAVGIILIYRTNQIINFAAAALGAVPGVLAALLLVVTWQQYWWAWYVCLPIAVVGGALLGGLSDVFVIRRFGKAPRLILTVATIGLAQLFAFIAFMIPIWLGSDRRPISYVPSPFKGIDWMNFRIGGTPFHGDYPFSIGAVLVIVLALAAFLRYTRMGIAIRASAENADRASLLGIPVKRVQTVAWILAGTLAGFAIFFRAALVGVPTDGSLGPKVLLFALTAAVIGRMDSIPVALVAGMAVGILGEASVVNTGADSLASAIMLVLILGALMVQRGRLSRAYDTGVATWRSVKEFRPIPLELSGLREVRIVKYTLAAALVVLFIAAPRIPFIRDGRLGFVQLVLITSIIVVSLVILTGWAGQISLGQFGIVGIGATVSGKLVADYNQDFFVALVAGVAAGALVAVLIGLPALRIPGLYLAVATLAFGAAVQFYFLDDSYRIGQILRPDRANRIDLPVMWERWVLTAERGDPGVGFYYLCLAFLALTLLAARAYRRNRAGRVLMAVRENTRAASSYAVNPSRTKLAAFAVSGAIAALGGVLMAYHASAIDSGAYSIDSSIVVFTIAVIGGLTSLTGAVTGAIVIETIRLLGSQILSGIEFLVTGVGLLVVLMVIPGGFAEVIYGVRDNYLRWVAKRHGLLVPSLLADRRAEEDEEVVVIEEDHVIEEAERIAVEAGESFDVVLGSKEGEHG